MKPPSPSLWHNRAFVRLWAAQAVSGFGSRITGTAVPLTAALTLNATPAQMGFLVFAGQLPDLLFGLVAGVWVDRLRRRPILIGADLGRAALLALIPLAAFLDVLSFPLLWAVAFGTGVLTLFFTLAAVAVLPAIVEPEELVDANTKLSFSDSALSLLGPGAAGVLIQLFSAPRAILVDAASFLVSAWALGGIGSDEAAPPADTPRHGMRHEIAEGLRELVRTPLLRALAISMGILVVGGSVQATVAILYYTRTLDLSPAVIGALGACGGVGALAGAAVAGRVARRLGVGWAIIAPTALEGFAFVLLPLANLFPFAAALALLAISAALSGVAFSILSINQMSLRQRLTPTRLLGRVTAARRVLIMAMAPFGAALGGWLGTTLGFIPTLYIAALIAALAAPFVFFSPVREVKDTPKPPPATA